MPAGHSCRPCRTPLAALAPGPFRRDSLTLPNVFKGHPCPGTTLRNTQRTAGTRVGSGGDRAVAGASWPASRRWLSRFPGLPRASVRCTMRRARSRCSTDSASRSSYRTTTRAASATCGRTTRATGWASWRRRSSPNSAGSTRHYSPYTDEWFAKVTETDIEHIVAVSEAHR